MQQHHHQQGLWHVAATMFVVWAATTQKTTAQRIIQVSCTNDLQLVNNALFAGEKFITITLQAGIAFGEASSKQLLPLGFDHTTQKCHPFSGTFNGKNNALSGIEVKMPRDDENANTDKCSGDDVKGGVDLCGVCGAGLFCGIENAFVENVVLDSSCSFEGVFAGGLSGCVGGNVSVVNVKTMATTTATQAAGGLFALFHQTTTTTTTTTTRNDEEDVEQSAPVVQNVLVHANVSIKSTTQTQTTTQRRRRSTEESIACGVCDKVSSGCVNVVVFGGGSVGGGTQNHNLWAQTVGNQQQQQAHQNIFVVQQGEEQGEQEGVEGNASVVVFDENKQCFVVVDTQHLQSNNNNDGEETKQQVCVDKELNQVVQQQRWGAAWLSTLDLVFSFSVTFGQPASVSTSGSAGKTMLDVVKLSSLLFTTEVKNKILDGSFVLVAKEAGNGGLVDGGDVVGLDMVLVGELNVLLCHNVSVVDGCGGDVLFVVFVEHEQQLCSNDELAVLFDEPCDVVHVDNNNNNNNNECVLFVVNDGGNDESNNNEEEEEAKCEMNVMEHMVLVVQHKCPSSSLSQSSSSSSSSTVLSSVEQQPSTTPTSTTVSSLPSTTSTPTEQTSSTTQSEQSQTQTTTSSSSNNNKGGTHVWIDLDGTVVVVDEDETKANIGAILTNLIGKQVVVVEIKTDNNGKLTQVVVVVSGGDEAAQAIIEAINKNKNTSNSNECTVGVLCHATDAFLDPNSNTQPESPSAAPMLLCPHTLFVFVFLSLFVLL